MKRVNRQRGFTLIEVMIALAIVSIALAALTQSMGMTVLNQSKLESRIVATWVAEDELIKQHVLSGQKDKQAGASGQSTVVEQLGREWSIELRSESTTFPGIQKRVVIVTDVNNPSDSVSLVTVVGD
ncbi:MAG: type II secretion system minor pseudopilin GspI [Thiomicrorhabdus sp.]|nr:type II secretion system minor pseudopilin GspI [Thiomicrorhabdus sp.]MCF6298340.1 type II secretion system minor pseudopilin GspI [Thiomicrorhabdus sp.]